MFIYNDKEYEFVWMGLFTTEERWIHPEKNEKTNEIIYVVKGEVHIEEDNREYSLKKGELVILRPGITHRGTVESQGETSFYWLHFHSSRSDFPNYVRSFGESYLFRELLHYRNQSVYNENLVNSIFLHLLYAIEQAYDNDGKSSFADEVCEWARINADARLTVKKVAEHFGYNEEYISRVVAKARGMSLVKVIDRYKISRINELLCNTHYYIKEIARIMCFSDSGALINFYKYHQGISPSKFRELHSVTHMNKK